MISKSFWFEGRKYTVRLTEDKELVFFYDKYDNFSFDLVADPIHVTGLTNVTQDVFGLMKKIKSAVQEIVYEHGIKFFRFSVTDERRAAIYRRFLQGLKGYSHQEVDGYFWVVREDM